MKKNTQDELEQLHHKIFHLEKKLSEYKEIFGDFSKPELQKITESAELIAKAFRDIRKAESLLEKAFWGKESNPGGLFLFEAMFLNDDGTTLFDGWTPFGDKKNNIEVLKEYLARLFAAANKEKGQ